MPKEDRVVEPLGAMAKSEVPVEEAMTRGLTEPAVPTTERVAMGVEELMPSLPLVVSTTKMEEPEPFWIETAEVEAMFWIIPP